jgi:hypothetical protein
VVIVIVVLLFSVGFVVELEVPFEFTFVSICTVRAGGRETGACEVSLLVMRGVVAALVVVEFVVVVLAVVEALLEEEEAWG